MSDMFEIVESLPAGRANRHKEILDAFMKMDQRYAKLKDTENVRTNTLTLLKNHSGYPIVIHKHDDDIYLERTDLVGENQIR